jgi:hypothetical protein
MFIYRIVEYVYVLLYAPQLTGGGGGGEGGEI